MSAFHPLQTLGSSFIAAARMKAALLITGVAAALIGLLWIAQGSGLVHWPASSFMIDQRPWITRGAILALVGLILMVTSRRR